MGDTGTRVGDRSQNGGVGYGIYLKLKYLAKLIETLMITFLKVCISAYNFKTN